VPPGCRCGGYGSHQRSAAPGAAASFDGWLEPLSESLADLGVPLESSGNLAVVIAAHEGAIILARIGRDLTPFDALVLELGPLLDAVARPARRYRYEACSRWRARAARRLTRLPQSEVLCQTRDWFFELS
jgi:hypothetical protein